VEALVLFCHLNMITGCWKLKCQLSRDSLISSFLGLIRSNAH
jgi:hypothetical protein